MNRSGLSACGGLLLLVAVTTAGCGGSSPGAVHGAVTLDGELVRGGSVIFYCADGKSVLAGILPDGTYSADHLSPGEARVCVDTSALDPAQRKTYTYQPPPGMKKALPGSDRPAPAHVAIPPKYTRSETTELKVQIRSGRQSYDIVMNR